MPDRKRITISDLALYARVAELARERERKDNKRHDVAEIIVEALKAYLDKAEEAQANKDDSFTEQYRP